MKYNIRVLYLDEVKWSEENVSGKPEICTSLFSNVI